MIHFPFLEKRDNVRDISITYGVVTSVDKEEGWFNAIVYDHEDGFKTDRIPLGYVHSHIREEGDRYSKVVPGRPFTLHNYFDESGTGGHHTQLIFFLGGNRPPGWSKKIERR